MEITCKFNLDFVFLIQEEKAPDNNTISRLRREQLSLCIEDLITRLIKVLAKLDEIHFQNLFINSTKDRSQCKQIYIYVEESHRKE